MAVCSTWKRRDCRSIASFLSSTQVSIINPIMPSEQFVSWVSRDRSVNLTRLGTMCCASRFTFPFFFTLHNNLVHLADFVWGSRRIWSHYAAANFRCHCFTEGFSNVLNFGFHFPSLVLLQFNEQSIGSLMFKHSSPDWYYRFLDMLSNSICSFWDILSNSICSFWDGLSSFLRRYNWREAMKILVRMFPIWPICLVLVASKSRWRVEYL